MAGVSGASSQHVELRQKVVPSDDRRLTIAWVHTGDSGGSKRAAFEMVRELHRRGHIIDEYIVRIGSPNDEHWPLASFVREQYRHILPQTGNRLRPYLVQVWVALLQDLLKRRALILELQKVARDIRTRGYDVVHIDHCAPSYTVSLSAMVELPTIIYSHEVSGLRYAEGTNRTSAAPSLYRRACDFAIGILNGVKDREDLWGLKHASLLMTNSYYSKEVMFQRARCRSIVCRYGVDTETFRPLGLSREHMVLSAGRLVDAKQHHLVVKALSQIPADRRPRMVIATPEALTHQEDPAYAERVVELAKEGHVDLEIKRNPAEGDLVKLYNQARLLVFVPIMEPFGLVALEAMACGTPVVGIREGGVRESVLDGTTGCLVDRDPAEVAHAITNLLERPQLSEQCGTDAAEYVRREWSWLRSVDRYEHEILKLRNTIGHRVGS